MNTADLERALHARAEQAGPPPTDLLGRIADLRRARRRRRRAALAAAAAAVLVAVAVPTALVLTGDRGGSTAGPAEVPVLGVTTRGSLADDTALVAAVAGLSWAATAPSDTVADPPADSRHVDFLGDVEGTRYALVSGVVDGDRHAAWFTAPTGADASDLVLAGDPGFVVDDEPVAFADTTSGAPVVLVVAAPGDDVDFSDRAVLTADGTVDRSYAPGQDVDDGVAALPTSPDGVGAVSLRVSRDSIVVYRSRPTIHGDSGPTRVVDVAAQVADPRGALGVAVPERVATMLEDVTGPLQLPLDQVQPTLLWAGPVPGPENRETTAVVVGVTAPSGGSIAYAQAFTDVGDGAYGVTITGWETYDSSRPLLDRAQLVRNTVTDGTATGRPVTSLLLLDPVDVASTTPALPGATDLAPGVHLLPADRATTSVVVLDAETGETVTEAQLMEPGYVDRYDYGTGVG